MSNPYQIDKITLSGQSITATGDGLYINEQRLLPFSSGAYLEGRIDALNVPSPSYVTSTLGGDLTMTSANTYYDPLNIALTSGTWLITATVSINRAATTLSQYTAKLWATGVTGASTQASHPSQSPHAVSLSLSAIRQTDVAETWFLSCASSAATSSIIKAATANNSAGNTATTLNAIKIL